MAPNVMTRRRSGLPKGDSPSLSPASTTPSTVPSPKMSPSLTSLSSLDSDAAQDATLVNAKQRQQMIDTNGNTFEIPNFTIKEIRDAIPARCFKRSTLRSLGYVARDATVLATVFCLFNKYCTPEYVPYTGARAVLWSLYTVFQGMQATGIWVLAHECGHGGFSDHRWLNDLVGWVCHSALLVPYFSWKMTHGKHHKATANMERDMVFVPKVRSQYAKVFGFQVSELAELAEETPIVSVAYLLLQQLFGWPMYLITNATGHNYHERQPEGRGKGKVNGWRDGVNHFALQSPLFESRDIKYVLLSDLGLAIAGTALYLLVQKFSFANMLVWYFLPYLWVNHWLGKESCSNLSLQPPFSPLTSHKLPLPSYSTQIPRFRTTLPSPGPSRAAPRPPWTAILASWAAISSTASSRHTSFTTSSAISPFTTPTRPPRPSSPSWASIIARIPRMACAASCAPSGAATACATGSSRPRGPKARPAACCSIGTETGWGPSRPRRERVTVDKDSPDARGSRASFQ